MQSMTKSLRDKPCSQRHLVTNRPHIATRKLKDWFNRDAGLRLGEAIATVSSGFDAPAIAR